MTGASILSQFQTGWSKFGGFLKGKTQPRPSLHQFWLRPELLPGYARDTPSVMRTLELLGPLDWDHFPERDLQRKWRQPAGSYAAFSAAMLTKLNEGLKTIGSLRRHVVEHPGFIPLLGFCAARSLRYPWGFDPDVSLRTQRHLTRMLREMPNNVLQFLLADSVRLIRNELLLHNITIGECVSLDTKHVIAWVKENNPKAYIEDRFDKTKQPAGDLDCKLGCKRQQLFFLDLFLILSDTRHVSPLEMFGSIFRIAVRWKIVFQVEKQRKIANFLGVTVRNRNQLEFWVWSQPQ